MFTIQAMPVIEQPVTVMPSQGTFPALPVAAFKDDVIVFDVPFREIYGYRAVSNFVDPTFDVALDHEAPSLTTAIEALIARTSWSDRESREYYAEAAVEQGLAYQIRVNRELRGMTQRQLATAMSTRQSAVSRMEDPDYGSHSIPKLLQLAHVFDCALLIKLVPFSTLALEAKCLSEDHLYAKSYDEEITEEG